MAGVGEVGGGEVLKGLDGWQFLEGPGIARLQLPQRIHTCGRQGGDPCQGHVSLRQKGNGRIKEEAMIIYNIDLGFWPLQRPWKLSVCNLRKYWNSRQIEDIWVITVPFNIRFKCIRVLRSQLGLRVVDACDRGNFLHASILQEFT